MARAIERIDQELNTIKEEIVSLKDDFYQVYQRYLSALGKAVKQQLIMAGYHICTQGYPEAFVALPFTQRQKLQESLREMAKKTQEHLLLSLESSPILEDTEKQIHPETLAEWQKHLEEVINKNLYSLSHNANHLLQQMNILSNKVPEGLLEAASKAEGANEMTVGPPNLLNLMIEAHNSENPDNSTVMKIIAIHLRLSEIEFTDPLVMTERNQIRNLLTRLNTLGRDYQKKQQERIISEAESAWRSCWFED